ncbi:MAG: glycerate kinase [Chthoniobacterales bacterium]
MRILIAPDKFKGSLSAAEVAENIAAGLRDRLPTAEITLLPVADGGEGTARVICAAAGGEWHACEVHDALGRIVSARYCTIANGETAVMEISEASGLWRIGKDERDPLNASSFGTGEMLLDAAGRGAKEITIGLGGSATNDGGFGLARALGFRFLDAAGQELSGPVTALRELQHIAAPRRGWSCRITAAADVRNPLLGERGATRMFASQKGATAPQIEMLEDALTRMAAVAARDLDADFRVTSGAGAAGGLGFGLMVFCGAQLRSGFDVVAEAVGLEAAVEQVDVVITGEGRLDAQTLEGKAPAGVAELARKYGKPVYAVAGEMEEDGQLRSLFNGIFTAKGPEMSLQEAIAHAPDLLRKCGYDLASKLS